MNIYIDTEFTDFLCDPALISIGLVADNKREFYAELSDTYDESMCSLFVIETVLPILWGKEYEMDIGTLAGKLKAWIESFDETVNLWTDAPNYDGRWIAQIFDHHSAGWPVNLESKCKNTLTLATSSYQTFIDEYWRLSKNDGVVQHHALWDARCIQYAHHIDSIDF